MADEEVLQLADPVSLELFSAEASHEMAPMLLECGHTCSRKTITQVGSHG